MAGSRPDSGRLLAGALAGLYGALLAAVVLWPVPVDRPAAAVLRDLLGTLHRHGLPGWVGYGTVEAAANVLLFLPFGLLAGALLPPPRRWLAVAAAVLLSGAVELAQHNFLHDRFGTIQDVLANTLGAVLGTAAGSPLRSRPRRRPSWARSGARDRVFPDLGCRLPGLAGRRSRPDTMHFGRYTMALSASTTLPYSVAQVTDTFTSEAFLRHISELVGGSLVSVNRDGSVDGAFNLTVVRKLPTTRLPEIARKVVGESLTVTQTERWQAPAADGSRTADVEVKVAGAPVDAKAVQKLVAEGGSTRVQLEGEVTSGIPFLGGKIAAAAEPVLAKALKLQATQAEAWIASQA
ncbi:DUF2505 family protein [Arthrobacter sp. E918]|uniref:DUF2505 family protein n=2 Tax=Arthrobacter mobilis TaxID=2724944 RepID=A0A7X6K3C1_9MICC|nr:DUF2505 family protein [Arthrobacter mobilis]